jgi:hypothetical protein
MLVPYLERDFTDISGVLGWSKGTLSARSVAGQLGQTRISEGSMDYLLRDGQLRFDLDYDLDAAQALGAARGLLPQAQRRVLDAIRTAAGRAQGRFGMQFTPGTWRSDLTVVRSDSLLRVRDVPWPVRPRAWRATGAPGRWTIADAAGSIGASTFDGVGADLTLGKVLRVDGARGAATVALAELYPWLRAQTDLKGQLDQVTSLTGSLDVTVNRVAGTLDRVDALYYDATLRPRGVRLEVKGLPAPVAIDGGSIDVTPQALRFAGVVPGLLDAHVAVSGAVRDYRTGAPQVDASLANGEVGPTFMAWAWQRAGAPEQLLPKTPMRVAAQRVRWSKADGIDIRASAQVDAGPDVEADVGFKGDVLDVRSMHIKDRESDATLGLLTRGRLLETRFSGVLTGRSLAGLFKPRAGERTGRVEGDFRATIDRDLRGRSAAQGRLRGQRIQLEGLLGKPVTLERLDLDADGASLRVNDLSIAYAEQKATLRGEARRGSSGLVVDAELESPGIVLDPLLPERRETAPATIELLKKISPEALAVWPLPVEGKLKLQAGFVEYQHRRVEPFVATLDVEPERARLTVSQAALCGIAFPLGVELTPQGGVAYVRLLAKGQQLEATSGCLTDQNALLSGRFDLGVDLRTHGRRGDLANNLEGTVELHVGKGKVEKWGLLGRILAQESVRSSLAKRGLRPEERGLEYREIAMHAHLAGGRIHIDEAVFDGSTLGLAAKGSVGVGGRDVQLTVLVAPFSTIDSVVRKVPILGYVLGGSLTSIPVGVSGNMRDPQVVPLSPAAVTAELAGIFLRTFKLPGRILSFPQEVAKQTEVAR